MLDSKKIEDEIERCRLLLRASIRVSGLSVAEVERRLGYQPRTLQRVLLGRFDLKLRHILAVLQVLGIDYDEFYRAAAERRQAIITAAGGVLKRGETELRGRRSQILDTSMESDQAFQQLVDAAVEQTLTRLGWESEHRDHGGQEPENGGSPGSNLPVKPRTRHASRRKNRPAT